MTSLITPTNGDTAVIIGNRRCDHEFVIIAPVNLKLCLNLISNLAEENTCNESYYVLFSEFGIGIRRFEIRRNDKEPLYVEGGWGLTALSLSCIQPYEFVEQRFSIKLKLYNIALHKTMAKNCKTSIFIILNVH